VAATEEEAETLAALLTPQAVAAVRSPALSLEGGSSSGSEVDCEERPPSCKPGGPCDHCGCGGAC